MRSGGCGARASSRFRSRSITELLATGWRERWARTWPRGSIRSGCTFGPASRWSSPPTRQWCCLVRWGGAGPPILLLHGFPQTHLMWRRVAPLLARRFTVVCADLRGYGQSGCPASTPDHEPYSKRAMARDMVAVMARLGFQNFSVAGHDRGGRVAYRLALDHPTRVDGLAVLDIVPTQGAWHLADARLVTAFWPWSLLAQPEPLPERLLSAVPDAIIDHALGEWGSPPHVFEADVRVAYIQALSRPASVHAICEEYRAAAKLDHVHDAQDRLAGRPTVSPVLVLWSDRGPIGQS